MTFSDLCSASRVDEQSSVMLRERSKMASRKEDGVSVSPGKKALLAEHNAIVQALVDTQVCTADPPRLVCHPPCTHALPSSLSIVYRRGSPS